MPQVIDRVALRFEDNGKFHNDLVLCLGQEKRQCDSYYLLLDRGILPEREDASKVAAVLKCLLGQWRQAIESTPEGGVCFLPYDFSDEYTAWLRCEVRGPDLLVQTGWAAIEGWSITPSNVGGFLHQVHEFRSDSLVYEISREEFLRSLGGHTNGDSVSSLPTSPQ
jgi:hypothetical protein